VADKGTKLNKRVWKLFEDAGFKTKPNSQNPEEFKLTIAPGKHRTLDLFAQDESLGVKIIGWNKARSSLSESMTTHINDYAKLNEQIKADAIVFISTEKEFTDDDKAYAKKHKGTIWSENELKYYERLVETIKGYAKYEIVHSLGIETKEEQDIHTVLALRLRQPRFDSASDLYLFTITPSRLLRTCTVYRRAQGNPAAYQRMINKKRLPKIGAFLRQTEAILPTDMVLFLNEDITVSELNIDMGKLRDKSGKLVPISNKLAADLVALSIPMKYASMEIVDGQHRLYGFVHTEHATKDTFNLIAVGISKMPQQKRRDTFIAINDNARRMDPNLVSFLKYSDTSEEDCQRDNKLMAIKIVVELNKTTPFKNRIRLLDIGEEKITLKGFSGYDLTGLLSSRGLLRKYYDNKSQEFVSVLRMYFNIIKADFHEQYTHPEKYVIFTNRGISAFLKLLKSILKTHKAPLTPAIIKRYVGSLKKRTSSASWEINKLKESYVGSQGWKDFHRYLVKTIKKDYPDFRE
jgi:DGQHR domain-containing protein